MIAAPQKARGSFSSIQVKLVLAFLLVSVLPMLVAAQLASKVVSDAFEENVQTWLRETSVYFLNNIIEQQQEAAGVARFLAEQEEIARRLRERNVPLPAPLVRLMDALGYDLIAIYDEDRKFIYQSRPITGIDRVPLNSDNSLYRVTLPDRSLVMAAGVRRFEVDNKPYFLVLGTWLDENFIGSMKALTSLELRLYFRRDGAFTELFSAQRGVGPQEPLPPAVERALLSGTETYYDPDADEGRYRGMYSAMRDNQGALVGAIFCGIKSRETLSGWLTRTNLFLSIFVIGTLLSVLAGIVVSRQLSRPLRSLGKGVQAITAGDFNQRVKVQGRDEVAELATAFNVMAARLGQLHELEAQLRRRDRLSALGEVAVGIAHEVRNPLGIIKTSAELVQKRAKLPPADEKLLNYVIDEVRRIDHLINEFLAFAKPAPPALRTVRPREVIERVGRFAEPELARKHIALTITDNATDAVVEGDEDQLFQASLNLILNAADAMPDGGRLSIALNVVDQDLRIDFSDTGHGISVDIQERIFNPFFTTKEKGTGLGLAKVFAVMESHRGHVDCRSAPGDGATFTLILPLSRRKPVDAAYHLAGG
ncbi:MAG TPA: ATP-binding protein [Candidatus Cybelea sp.]|nr:ATP-binding protein [Candidatus Cybelea sp.]